ncbi:hypothetical protein NZK33_20230 [Cyanobium sp. FGCU-6]|nr:hypothetical protein [Cyanobium sp. FGCU6]
MFGATPFVHRTPAAAPGGGALALRAAGGYGKLDWDPGYDDKAERERQR